MFKTSFSVFVAVDLRRTSKIVGTLLGKPILLDHQGPVLRRANKTIQWINICPAGMCLKIVLDDPPERDLSTLQTTWRQMSVTLGSRYSKRD